MKKQNIYFDIKPHTSYSNIRNVIDSSIDVKQHVKANNKGVQYINVPCAFDIETTSFYTDVDGRTYGYSEGMSEELTKCSTMYIWQLGINGRVVIGRTWEQFLTVCNIISEELELSSTRKLIIYVHNLSYEFQFIRKLFTWEKVFSLDLRKPVYALTSLGIEFRCSYLLSGYSLEKLGEQLTKYKCSKLVGALDYNLIRHTETELTTNELMYCVNDVVVVMCYIQELIEQYKNITRLPLTNTSFVRRYCRKQCLKVQVNGKSTNNYKYINMIHSLNIGSLEEFNAMQRAFSGGFTHANSDKVGNVYSDVASYDFTSSYPYVMVSEQFPMSSGVRFRVKSFEQLQVICSKYCAIFDIELINVFPKVSENIISASKCYVKENATENNGRIVCASRLLLTVTNIDFLALQDFYQWESIKVGTCYIYKKDYLPTELVTAILKLYADKTTLKGVEGKEVEYLNAKGMLNSCYGMCVTNPLREEYIYTDEWSTKELTNEEKREMLDKHNNSQNRFLFYAWGVFVTAFARRNLYSGILSVGNDYIYSDTDSIKCTNREQHKDYFRQYNDDVLYKLRKACKYHNIPVDAVEPKTIKGINKLLGVWDYEGTYKRFKTLGAKRYMVEEENGKLNITVSGVNKKVAVPYLKKVCGNDNTKVFEAFTNYLDIPPTCSGKNIHTYIDFSQEGTLTDYNGKQCRYSEQSSVHLEPCGYTLSISKMYINYLMGIKMKN